MPVVDACMHVARVYSLFGGNVGYVGYVDFVLFGLIDWLTGYSVVGWLVPRFTDQLPRAGSLDDRSIRSFLASVCTSANTALSNRIQYIPYNILSTFVNIIINIIALFLPPQFGIAFLVLPCLLLATVIHPTLNQNFVTDVAWTLALYLETLAVIPQLYMFQKSGSVEPWTSHFVFTLGLSRVFLFSFWLSSYHELNDKRGQVSQSVCVD
jgi:hypothetical protein